MQTRFIGVTASLLVAGTLLLSGCVHSPPDKPWDPIEPANRAVFKFNRKADQYVLKPVAKGYDTVTPDPVQSSIGNFFANAHEPVTIVNSALQLNFKRFNESLGRFMINTVAGVGGLFDVASKVGVPDPDEDFGQTFAVWGLGRGPYLVLPVFGPSDGRDFVGRVGDHWLYPITYLDWVDSDYQYIEYGLGVLYAANKRAEYLGYEQLLAHQFDPYIFMRGYYLKWRDKQINNEADTRGANDDNQMPTGG
ncbi:VacJ family lipoprotein [Salinisphaera sp. USBA-960]|uniref:MlaA family lipoprotein n=1 Tax=Salinisphaera orenii TaxID=856731 RepID=UPI000DBEA9FB|nr:VacJ family lipoprotein [Salifodinibacter halophilus]NNC27245.1 VacJ family lipoprotein [Salifodinibacter halophilus]